MTQILIISGAIIGLLVIIGLVYSVLYKRASKGVAFVRTGLGGELVVLDSGALCLPIFHEIIHVNMNTLKLEVFRREKQALITKDHMRVDVAVECHLRVMFTKDAISMAAQTLGSKTLDPNELRIILEPKIIDSLRSVASSMNIEELHEQRAEFVQKVLGSVKLDLEKNGLELESVSLTSLDQTSIEFFSNDNIFDARGLTKITQTIQSKRKERNEIEQNTAVEISQKNLETNQRLLAIERDESFARLEQERAVSIRTAEQDTAVAQQKAEQERLAEEAKITAKQEIQLREIESSRKIQNEEILTSQSIEQARINQAKTIKLAEQDQQIAISEKSEAESEAKRKADEARVAAIQAQERVETARQVEIANRAKSIEIIKAEEIAERDAVGIKVQAAAELEAAQALAEAKVVEATASKDAEMLIADAKQRTYEVEAKGVQSISEAKNLLNNDQVQFEIKQLLIKHLPEIIKASTEPMKNIDDIKILQVSGLGGLGGLGGSAGAASSLNGSSGGGTLPEQVVNSALQYRVQSKLIDGLMGELGMEGATLQGIVKPFTDDIVSNTVTDTTVNTPIEPNPEQEVGSQNLPAEDDIVQQYTPQ